MVRRAQQAARRRVARSLDGFRARERILSTDTVSPDAHNLLDHISRVFLCVPSDLLIEHDVRVTVASSSQIERSDSDFFSEQ